MAIVGSLEQRGRDFKDLKDFRDCRVFRVFRDSRDFKDLRSLRSLKFLKSLFLVFQTLLFDKVSIIEIVDAHGFAHLVHCLCSRFTSLFSTFL